MLVKICGITTIEAAKVASASGADLIGFVFAPSKREITKERAQEIRQALPSTVKTVGVFVNETVENMQRIKDYVGLDFIQLHGDEPDEVAHALAGQIIKAFPVTEDTLSEIQTYPADFYILDSPIGGARGGNGTVFNWDLATDLPIEKSKIILAGGLNVENVQTAIKRLHPIGVDVSSGVETNGEKDLEKIKKFIHAAKTTAL